jgi:hypothetical protein
MIQTLENIAQSLEIPTPLSSRVWVPGRSEAENHLVELLCHIAGVDHWSSLLQVHVPLTYAVRDAAVRLGMDGEDVEMFALQAFRFLVKEHKRNNLTKWPSQTGSPRYAFLAAGYTSKDRKLDTRLDPSLLPPMHRCISHETLRGLIKLENKIAALTSGKSNIPSRCGWAARLLVLYAPNVNDTNLEQILSQRLHAADAFEARHRKVSRRRGYNTGRDEEEIQNLRQRFVRRHLIALNVLLTGKINAKLRQRALLSRAQRRWLQLSKKRLSEGDSSRGASQISQPMSAWELQDAAALGVAPGEFEQVLVQGTRQHERAGSMWAHLRRTALVYKNEQAVAWSRELPTLTDLAQCYKNWFGSQWSTQDGARQLAVFKAMLNLHHGLLPELVTPIRVGTRRQGRKLLQNDGIYLDKERLTITMLLPVQLEPEFLLADKEWEDRGLVEIHLHPTLRTMLERLLIHYPFPKSGERWIPPNTPATRVLPPGVTAQKLCHCFESYYSQRHGLEPELASLVAGRPVLGRNASVHYFRTTSDRLHREYWKAFERFHGDIWQVGKSQHLGLIEPVPWQTIPMQELSSQPVGSLFYPNKTKLTQYLNALKKRLEWLRKMGDHKRWREVLAVYVYECLRLVTGMRVIDEPQFNALCLMCEGNWLQLREKGPNPRVVPVHLVVADLITTLAQANAWFHGRFNPRGSRYEGPLFFIERDGKTELLSTALIKEVCRKQKLTHPGGRPNAHRHLMRSQIHDCGLNHKIADFVLGHTHQGPHVQDQLSLVPMEQLRRRFMPVADSLVRELGIEKVRAWS